MENSLKITDKHFDEFCQLWERNAPRMHCLYVHFLCTYTELLKTTSRKRIFDPQKSCILAVKKIKV